MLYFLESEFHENLESARWLNFLSLHYPGGRRYRKKYSTALNYYRIIRRISKFSKRIGVPLLEILSNKAHLLNLSKISSRTQKKGLKSLIGFFYSIPSEISGFRCPNPESIISSDFSDEDAKQTAPIPERILDLAILKVTEVINDYLSSEAEIIVLCQKIMQSRTYARSHTVQRDYISDRKYYDHNFDEAIFKHNLTALSYKYKIEDVSNLCRFLSTVQFCCKTLIHAFSGMRNGEVRSLKRNCLEKRTYKGVDTLNLLGVTTKFAPGSGSPTYWVTSPEVHCAIKASESILKLISEHINKPIDELYLFTSTSHLNFSNGNFHLQSDTPILGDLRNFLYNDRVFSDDAFRITEEDLHFLEKADPLREWGLEQKFKKGNLWPFSTHQFRRSLAIYGLSSGLVSLSSLKRQFKHISLAMTLYYVRGLLSQEKLFGESPRHFRNEVLSIKSLVQALDYISLQTSTEKLAGAHGTYIENKVKSLGIAAIKASREETISRFRNGEINYHATPTGGCISVEPCLRPIHSPLNRCADCSKRVLIISKAKEVARNYEDRIKTLPDGPEKVMEQLEVKTLLDIIHSEESL